MIDEKRPAVLQVGDHHQADDTEDELAPPCPFGRNCAKLSLNHGVVIPFDVPVSMST
jgi:hypothetical protein